MGFRIEASTDGEPTQSVELTSSGPVRIGRDPNRNDLFLDDAPGAHPIMTPGRGQPPALISRLHAEVELRPSGEVIVRDLGSGGGTYLHGRLVKEAPWRPGEPLKIGRWTVVLERSSN